MNVLLDNCNITEEIWFISVDVQSFLVVDLSQLVAFLSEVGKTYSIPGVVVSRVNPHGSSEACQTLLQLLNSKVLMTKAVLATLDCEVVEIGLGAGAFGTNGALRTGCGGTDTASAEESMSSLPEISKCTVRLEFKFP